VVRLCWGQFEIYGSQEMKEKSSRQMLSIRRRHCLNFKGYMTMNTVEKNVMTFKMNSRWSLLIKFNPVCAHMSLSLKNKGNKLLKLICKSVNTKDCIEIFGMTPDFMKQKYKSVIDAQCKVHNRSCAQQEGTSCIGSRLELHLLTSDVLSPRPRTLYLRGKSVWYPLNRGLHGTHSWSTSFPEESNLSSLPEIETWSLGYSSRIPLTERTTPPHILSTWKYYKFIKRQQVICDFLGTKRHLLPPS
jgi:hypothetical protein